MATKTKKQQRVPEPAPEGVLNLAVIKNSREQTRIMDLLDRCRAFKEAIDEAETALKGKKNHGKHEGGGIIDELASSLIPFGRAFVYNGRIFRVKDGRASGVGIDKLTKSMLTHGVSAEDVNEILQEIEMTNPDKKES